MSSSSIVPGCAALSHAGMCAAGVVAIHGFTGSPASMRNQATALQSAGYHVEVPRLPGHGTTIDDMLATGWDDWSAEVDDAVQRLGERVDDIVVMGQSMGGALALSVALAHPEVRGVVCVNPVTLLPDPDVLAMVEEMLDDGTDVMPGIGSDIADPDVEEFAYAGTPLRPLLSFMRNGVAPITDRLGELSMPILLYTSRQDHVVEPASSEHLAAAAGGDVHHVWLERSYHVATQDYDRDVISAGTIAFVRQVTGR